jgi:hypothetical protein
MQKCDNPVEACVVRPAPLPEAERALLTHVEMCYSVALALTRDPVLGQRLARETLLWAWQCQGQMGGLGGDHVKMALLKNLRSRFLHKYYPACSEDVRRGEPFAFSTGSGRPGASETGKEAVCAATGAAHAETGAGE